MGGNLYVVASSAAVLLILFFFCPAASDDPTITEKTCPLIATLGLLLSLRHSCTVRPCCCCSPPPAATCHACSSCHLNPISLGADSSKLVIQSIVKQSLINLRDILCIFGYCSASAVLLTFLPLPNYSSSLLSPPILPMSSRYLLKASPCSMA